MNSFKSVLRGGLLFFILASGCLSTLVSQAAGSRFTFDAGMYNNPPPALFGLGLSYRLSNAFSIGLGYDLLNLLSSQDLYGSDLRWYAVRFEKVKFFASGGVTFYDCPDYDAFLFHASAGVEWRMTANWLLVGGLTYVTHSQSSYITPRIALTYPF